MFIRLLFNKYLIVFTLPCSIALKSWLRSWLRLLFIYINGGFLIHLIALGPVNILTGLLILAGLEPRDPRYDAHKKADEQDEN